jgi:hypothetical protein
MVLCEGHASWLQTAAAAACMFVRVDLVVGDVATRHCMVSAGFSACRLLAVLPLILFVLA